MRLRVVDVGDLGVELDRGLNAAAGRVQLADVVLFEPASKQ
jgi:hypothetical protein